MKEKEEALPRQNRERGQDHGARAAGTLPRDFQDTEEYAFTSSRSDLDSGPYSVDR